MRLFPTERTQKDSNFVESCEFSPLEGGLGLNTQGGVGLGRPF